MTLYEIGILRIFAIGRRRCQDKVTGSINTAGAMGGLPVYYLLVEDGRGLPPAHLGMTSFLIY